MDPRKIRNFCIIAHIDHGKSTLADRFLEITGTVEPRQMREQFLDQMDIEREKGVTIKASAVRMVYKASDGEEYVLNLIDTPGHVDFSYEVSRALAACEGAVLVVDASQGIEAQTVANLYMALEHDLTIIPVINKIDLPNARPEEVAQELEDLLGIPAEEAIMVSAKEGINVEEVLEAVVRKIPPPKGYLRQPLRALIFDSHYDSYKGVVAYVRVVDGEITPQSTLMLMSSGVKFEPMEIGYFAPWMTPTEKLVAGEVGYVATGLKSVRECSVGDTITWARNPAEKPLPGYKKPKPMVFAGFYPTEGENFGLLREALEKLQLNDSALFFEPEDSAALGPGFRCGFLGLFHMEIVQERLEREFGLDLVATAPNVEYEVVKRNGEVIRVDNPARFPPESEIEEIREPWMRVQIFTPSEYIGPIMELVSKRRGKFVRMDYLDPRRVMLLYEMPLAEMITDFYDRLKSVSRGYASLDYSFLEYRPDNLVKLTLLVHGQPVDALSVIVHRDDAYRRGKVLVERLKEVIPRQLFPVAIQAAIGKRVVARADIPALKKNVLAKCYGGDVTRKRKLLERQKEGKKRLKQIGRVQVPQEAFLAILKVEED